MNPSERSAPGFGTSRQYWSREAEELLESLSSSRTGLASAEAAVRLARQGPNTIAREAGVDASRLLARQFASPLVAILVIGAAVSLFVGDLADAAIILAIVLGSTLLGFSQEYRASSAISELRGRLALTVRALRDGKPCTIPAAGLVPGDVVELSAGKLVPADGIVLSAKDFLVTEASLTGESMPVEKRPCVVDAGAPIARRENCAFMGTSVRSGTATLLVVATGRDTEFGAVADRLNIRPPETEFKRGVRHFGQLLLKIMLAIVIFVLAINHLLGRPRSSRCCSRSHWLSACRRSCCLPSSASRWLVARARWPRAASSSVASTRSRTSAAWTYCARTRPAR